MSESVPSSITGFAHRRSRADSATSFTYMQEGEESSEWTEEEAIIDQSDDEPEERDGLYADGSSSPSESRERRKSSGFSRRSFEDPLLPHRDSTATEMSYFGRGKRINQRIYIVTEDLTIVVSGFVTSFMGYASYIILCTLTCGIAYLLLRWLPRWRVRLVGKHKPLRECSWVVVENQWGEFEVEYLAREQYGHSVSTVFGLTEKGPYNDMDEEDDPVISTLHLLDYRYMRFCFHPLKDKFILCSNWKDPSWTNVKSIRAGLDSDERYQREQIFGKNQISIKQKTIPQLLVDEAFHPFYVFQVCSLVLWSLDDYYFYAICIFLISVVSITTTLLETKSTMKKLREISYFECDVRVIRNGFWRQVPSIELVPGDVYEVSDPSLTQLPCDSLLLAGDCIVNESMLTGESVPVSKIPATNESLRLVDLASSTIHPEAARNFLFSGTRIIRARRPQDGTDEEAVALAIVARTGFNTTKGALVRSMLFPKPSGFKFYKDAFRYISVMAAVAGVGFIASFVNFLAWHLIIVRALDLITIVVPPALPATLTIGTNFALSRLRTKKIFCISPQRVNVGGKIDVICFDKTGTLTEDGLDVLGVRVVQRPAMKFSELLSSSLTLLPGAAYERDPTVNYDAHKAALHTMASCHSLRNVDGDLIGDPLDLKMFEFTNWTFTEGSLDRFSQQYDELKSQDCSNAKPPAGLEFEPIDLNESENNVAIQLNIIKGFDFVSQLRRQSVVVSQPGNGCANIYVKGAPECMRDICRPDSFPTDYEELLGFYTHRGFRVIACATKKVPYDWASLQRIERETAERDLDLIGFIIFENKLKAATAETIKQLENAAIRQIMCTGDNILTAVSVARECSLIDRTAHCFVPHVVEGSIRDPDARLTWQSVDNPLFTLDEKTLTPLPPPAESDVSLPYDMANLRNYSLAITGDIFRWIVDFGDEPVLQRMLVAAQVFARMSPDEKHELVEKLQTIEYCCGFCGDGANDCGALKAADVGISLSEAEASVAAPFTSRVFDISCVPEVIREGRAALVTSFCCFKYMSLYSAIQFTTVSFLYASASNLGDLQFLFIDLFLILPIAIFMGWTGPYPTLCRKRPTASLVSRKILTPLLGQIGLCILIQSLAFEYVRQQSWFIPPVLDKERSNIENSENTALYLLSCFQYILLATVISVGPPFRQSMTHNLPFVITIVVALLLCSYMLFDPAAWLTSSMQLTYMTAQFKVFILALAIGGFACAWVAERRVFLLVASVIGKTHDLLWPHRRKKRKLYKTLLDSMHWALDGGYLPQTIIRYGIRAQLQSRIKAIASTSLEESYRSKMQYVDALRTRPMAIETATANKQHYEVGTGVLQACLGPRMKYSCCLYPTGSETLGQAEIEMLDVYVDRADLKDGMSILDLGCGWGSGALYFAEIFPHSQITAFSNSQSQKKYIDQQAYSKGMGNLKVITGDIVDYEFEPGHFDRVVSIELFEHMKNYELLMAKVARSLKAGGKLFVHIFSHKTTPYDFEDGWMSTHFFSGGTMPSADLLHYFQKDLTLTKQWWVSGKHYAKTSEDWLWKLSNSKTAIWPHLEATYGKEQAGTWFQRWKIFYMACAELFGYEGGDTWGVSHYLFVKGSN
ncbi:MAG: hypothetical protein Q9171_001209 [Xanthocarpia ochracea]